MEVYKVCMDFKKQIGFLVSFDEKCYNEVIISIPFVEIIIHFHSDAKGYYIFGKEKN